MQQPEDERPISPSDLLSLPPAQRRIVRILLRSSGMTLGELSQALEGYPAEEWMAPDVLAESLDHLEHSGWLTRLEGTDPPVYHAARLGWTGPSHAGERVTERHRSGASRLNGFWDSVKEDEEKHPRPPASGGARRLPSASGGVSSLFSELARPNTSLSDVLAERKAPPTKPGGGRISSLFDELSKTTTQPAPDPEASDDDTQA